MTTKKNQAGGLFMTSNNTDLASRIPLVIARSALHMGWNGVCRDGSGVVFRSGVETGGAACSDVMELWLRALGPWVMGDGI